MVSKCLEVLAWAHPLQIASTAAHVYAHSIALELCVCQACGTCGIPHAPHSPVCLSFGMLVLHSPAREGECCPRHRGLPLGPPRISCMVRPRATAHFGTGGPELTCSVFPDRTQRTCSWHVARVSYGYILHLRLGYFAAGAGQQLKPAI